MGTSFEDGQPRAEVGTKAFDDFSYAREEINTLGELFNKYFCTGKWGSSQWHLSTLDLKQSAESLKLSADFVPMMSELQLSMYGQLDNRQRNEIRVMYKAIKSLLSGSLYKGLNHEQIIRRTDLLVDRLIEGGVLEEGARGARKALYQQSALKSASLFSPLH